MVFETIGGWYGASHGFANTVAAVLGTAAAYNFIYLLLGVFFTRRFRHTENRHKYAILIAARNEECVIGNLLDSIKKQDYPAELLTVFVAADNCTDETARIARDFGAVCYERRDNDRRTKGYALQFLFENIKKDYGITAFEGYFIFDADNLLMPDYVSRMNDAFDSGVKITTSYRNTKNFDDNWISAIYALHWLRSIRVRHRARSVLRLATNIQGTGFLFSNEVVKDGWKYTSLTEDRALTADAVAQGYQISYNDEAMFYDEQPVSLKIALRQRLRWSRGHILAFAETGPKLFVNIIFGKLFLKNRWDAENAKNKKDNSLKGLALRFVESIRHRFASFDTLMQLAPLSVAYIFMWLVADLVFFSCGVWAKGLEEIDLFGGGGLITAFIRSVFDVKFRLKLPPGTSSMFAGIALALWLRLLYLAGKYIKNIGYAVYVFIAERKKIKPIGLLKKIFYCLAWPMFDLIGRYTTCIAVFVKVGWKPIPHKSGITIDDIAGAEKKDTVGR